MLLTYLIAVVCCGAIAAVRPSCTPALVAWYGLLIGGVAVELWWTVAGLAAHLAFSPWIGASLESWRELRL